jgi:hypothetical protein
VLDLVARLNAQLAIPLGFTLTASAVFVASISRWSQPDALAAWLFCAGGIAVHGVLVVALPTPRSPSGLAGGSLFVNVVPLAAIPFATLCSEWIDEPRIGYPLSGALAVLAYIGGLGLYLALLSRVGSARVRVSDDSDSPV